MHSPPRPQSVAFQNLSDMLDPFLGSPRVHQAAHVTAVLQVPPARPPPDRPKSVPLQSLEPGSPEVQGACELLVQRNGKDVPIQPWAVYSPISEPERSADMWNEPTLIMSRRSQANDNTAHLDNSTYALHSRVATLNQAVEQAESQVAFLQQSGIEKDAIIRNLQWDAEISNKKLAAAEGALDGSTHGEDEVARLRAKQQRVGSALANMLSELIEAKLDVKKVVGNDRILMARCTHLELEVTSLRSQMRDSFVGYDKHHAALDSELTEALELNVQLEAKVTELSAEISDLKLLNLKLENLVASSVISAQSDSPQAEEQFHHSNESLQNQNDLLKKQNAAALQKSEEMARELERLVLVEDTIASLQRDHDALHKVHSESQHELERLRLKQERDRESRVIMSSGSREVSSSSTPAGALAPHGQASVSTILSTTLDSLHEDVPRDYLLGMHIVSKGNVMTVKSFTPGSVCSKALRAGNQLISIDGRRIKDANHLRQICRGVPGTIVSIKFKQTSSEEVFELQLLRGISAQGEPVLTEHIPCTPRGPPPLPAHVAQTDTDTKLRALEMKWERQLEEVLTAKAESQRQHSEALKAKRAAEDEGQRTLAILAQVQSELSMRTEGESQALQALHHARTQERAAEEVARRLQEEARRVDAEKMELKQETLSLSSQIALLQTQLSLAVRESFSRPAHADTQRATGGATSQEEDCKEKQTVQATGRTYPDMHHATTHEPELLEEAQEHMLKKLQAQVAALQVTLREKEALLQEKTRELNAQEQQLSSLRRRSQQVDPALVEREKSARACMEDQSAHIQHQQTCIAELENRAANLAQELQTCNDLLESELIKAGEQTEIMNALAEDVSRWQTRYEELEARGVDNMFSRDRGSANGKHVAVCPDESLMEAHVQEQVATALHGALAKMSLLERDKAKMEQEQRRMEKEVEQIAFDKSVLEKGLDEAMAELRAQAAQLAAARGMAAKSRDLLAQEAALRVLTEEKLEEESRKLRAAQASTDHLSHS